MDHPTNGQPSRRARLRDFALAALGALLLAAALAAPASADDEAHPFLESASQLEGLEDACGAAVDSAGDVYVSNWESAEIMIFDPSGSPIASFAPEDANGEVVFPCSLAVDSSGDVYVTGWDSIFAPKKKRVIKFSPEGGAFPPTGSTGYEVDTAAGDEGTIVAENASSVAVDPLDQSVVVSLYGANEGQALKWPSTAECPVGKEVTLTYVPTGQTTSPISCGIKKGQLESVLATFAGGDIGLLGNEPNYRFSLSGALGNEDVPTGMIKLQGVGGLTLEKSSTAINGGEGRRSSISTYSATGQLLEGGIGLGVAHAAYEAVDVDGPTGKIYALDSQSREVAVFDPSGPVATPEETIDGTDSPEFSGGFGELAEGDLAVDQSSGNVYVADIGLPFSNPGESHGVVSEFTAEGDFVSQIGPQFGDDGLEFLNEYESPIGLAVGNGASSPTPGTLYVATPESLLAFERDASVVPTPQVLGVSPDKGQLAGGTSVTVTGRNLAGADAVGGAVEFGDASATNVAVNGTGTQLTATAPAHAGGTVHVTVTTPEGTSAEGAGDEYTYFGTPSVTDVTPDKGPLGGGQTVTIEGDNLEDVTEVKFGSTVLSTTITEEGAGTKLKVTSPAAAGAGTVQISVVTLNGGTFAGSTASQYTYFGAPSVTDVTPDKGPLGGGQTVTIEGDNLQDVTEVKFGSTVLSTTIAEEGAGTKLKVTSPAGSVGTVQISVTTPGGSHLATGSAGDYAYVALPSVTDVTPDKGPLGGGQTVTIEGDNLQDVTEVKFGSTVLSTTIAEEGAGTKLVVRSPSASTDETVDVRVRTAGGLSLTGAGDEYTYIAPLTFAVEKAGAGSGSVTCDGGACDSTYPYGSSVSLAATADPGSTSAGFSGGGCSGTGGCTVVVKSRVTVTATFNAMPQEKDGGGGQAPPPPPASEEGAIVDLAPAAQVKGGTVQLNVFCPGPGPCKGTIKLTAKVKVGKKAKTIVVGTASYEIPAGSSTVVKVKLSGAAKKWLKKGGLKVKVSGGDASGTVTLKAGG